MVFAHLCYRGPLLGVDLAVTRECEPPSVDVCLPCDAYILGGFSRCFLGFFLVSFSLFGPGTARASSIPIIIYTNLYSLYKYLIKLSTIKEKRFIINIIAL